MEVSRVDHKEPLKEKCKMSFVDKKLKIVMTVSKSLKGLSHEIFDPLFAFYQFFT